MIFLIRQAVATNPVYSNSYYTARSQEIDTDRSRRCGKDWTSGEESARQSVWSQRVSSPSTLCPNAVLYRKRSPRQPRQSLSPSRECGIRKAWRTQPSSPHQRPRTDAYPDVLSPFAHAPASPKPPQTAPPSRHPAPRHTPA